MYISRIIDNQLIEWRNSANHKPLLLRGARQVGKSSAVKHLAESFDYYIEANFERKPELKSLFEQVTDVKELSSRLGMMYGKPIVPGKTLLFLDEIQSCADAIKRLWFFKEDFPELHVIAAGSLLEFALKDLTSFGVGRIRSLFMYPLSFDEFLNAQGKQSWIAEKQNAQYDKPLFEALHSELVQQFRTFLMVGGMPASVAAWAETHDYQVCLAEQDDIQQTYYDDFVKYKEKLDPTLLRNTLQSVVIQIGKKFAYSKVDGNYKPEDVKKALAMLCDAGIIKRVSHTAANGLPFGAEVNDKFRKYIFLDSGLLLRILDIDFGRATEITDLILAGTAENLVNKGGLAEMVLGWEMIKYGNPRAQQDLYYWENLDRGATSEVDYVIAKNMKVVPVEVKANVTGKMKSLRVFMNKKHLTEAYRCSLENFSFVEYSDENDDGAVRRIMINPLYAVSNFVK